MRFARSHRSVAASGEGEHVGLEGVEGLRAVFHRFLGGRPPRTPQAIPGGDIIEPPLDLGEVVSDLLGFLKRVGVPEPFELDLFAELRLALFDDLGVPLGGQVLGDLDQFGVPVAG